MKKRGEKMSNLTPEQIDALVKQGKEIISILPDEAKKDLLVPIAHSLGRAPQVFLMYCSIHLTN